METFRRLNRIIAKYELIFYLLLLPFALFPSPARLPALLIIPLLWLANKIGNGRFFPRTPFNISLTLLAFMILVSMYATFDMAFSLGKIIGLWYGIGLFFAVTTFTTTSLQRQRWGIAAFLLVGSAIGMVSLLGMTRSHKFPFLSPLIAQLPAQAQWLPGIEAAISTNQTAGVLLWVAPLALALMVTGVMELRRRRSVLPLLLAITAIAGFLTAVLLLTQSRGGLLGFVIGVGAMAAILLRRQWRWLLLIAGIGALAAGLLWWQMGDEITAVITTQAKVDLANPVGTLDSRLEIWSRALYGLQDFPFTGMGMNNFRRVVHILYPLFLVSPDSDIAHAHNQWLQAGLDLGLPGLIAYIAIWLGATAMLFKTWQRNHDLWQRAAVLGFTGAMVASLVYGMTDLVALGSKPSFLWWIMLGLITGSFLHSKALSMVNSGINAHTTPVDN